MTGYRALKEKQNLQTLCMYESRGPYLDSDLLSHSAAVGKPDCKEAQ